MTPDQSLAATDPVSRPQKPKTAGPASRASAKASAPQTPKTPKKAQVPKAKKPADRVPASATKAVKGQEKPRAKPAAKSATKPTAKPTAKPQVVKPAKSVARPVKPAKAPAQAKAAAQVKKTLDKSGAKSVKPVKPAKASKAESVEKPEKVRRPRRKAVSLDKPSGRALADLVQKAALEHKVSAPVLLDLSGLSSVADWFFIASAENSRQIRAAAEKIVQRSLEAGIKPLGQEGLGRGETHWALVDLGDVVAHIFNAEARSLYDLEGLWADAPRG
ncbi:MAG: ribosome silencing factor [Deltaproteobacteria bacterium]|jgi:ribosome-associated protein|nr:ribosome silencing factor [Deltaproteobacteria bacterium]